MPRIARVVVPGVAHHVTQRGTGRQHVFYTRRDRQVYLRLLKQNCEGCGVRILAYCLMPNHVHLALVPEDEDSLAVALRRVHGRYAQYLNARRQRCGHLWQSRFYSCPMDDSHLWTALQYVERNPVRAGLVESPERYEWSSASAHLGGRDKWNLLDMDFWAHSGGVENWALLLGQPEESKLLKALRKATYAGAPFGSSEFVDQTQKLRGAALALLRATG